MATSVSLGYCLWLAGPTFNDSVGRNQHVAASYYLGATFAGVLPNNATPLVSAPSSGLSFTITSGAAVIPATSGDGSYMAANNATQTLTCNTAATQPRIDLLCLTVVDNGNNTSFAQLQIVQGTPGSSPVAPATPSNSIALCQITVPANAVTLVTGNFADVRVFTVAAGGIIPVPNMASLPAGSPSQIGYDIVNNRLFYLSPTGAKPLAIKNYPPALAIATSNINFPHASETTLLNVNFNSDGSDVLILGRYTDMSTQTATAKAGMRIYIDSTLVQETTHYTHNAQYSDSQYHNGGSIITHQTSSLKGTTPASGAHTASFRIFHYDAAGTVYAAANAPIELSVDVVIGH